jgi:hypothetical protein
VTRYAATMPFHMGALDGLVGVDGMVA